jgi:hypothetical protein
MYSGINISGSIQGEEFLEYLGKKIASQERLRYMKCLFLYSVVVHGLDV